MPKPRLLLHPGSSQGGSTWIQSLCLRNAEPLGAQGFHYLHEFRDLPFPKLATDDPTEFHAALDAYLDAKIPTLPETADGDEKTVFLSHENAFGDPLYDAGLFAQAPGLARNLMHMFDRFSAVDVIYVWRPLDRFLLSVYNQRKKQGSKITFPGYRKTLEGRQTDSRHVVKALRLLSGTAKVHIIHFAFLAKRQRRFAAEFLGLGGVRLDADFDFAQNARNPSISPEGIKILEFAKDLLDKPRYMEMRKFVQAKLPKEGMTAEEKDFLADWAERSATNDRVSRDKLAEFAHFIDMPKELGPEA